MKRLLVAATLVTMLASAGTAEAASPCLKGALVGGVAGHYAHHHTILGAIGGCIIGHEAAKHAQQKKNQKLPPDQLPTDSTQQTQ